MTPSSSSSSPSTTISAIVSKSSSSSSSSSASLTTTTTAAAACSSSSPNSSVSCSQQALQDTLYEYVRGLQDAIKVPDPELAERLLVEIGSALSLPSAVSLIISANGACLIASCVKHFRGAGTGKAGKVASSKVSKSGGGGGAGRSSSSKSDEHDPGGQVVAPAFTEAARAEFLDVLESTVTAAAAAAVAAMDEVVLPSESRRKRQRTVVEEEDVVPCYQNRECRSSFLEKSRKPLKLKGRSLKVGSSRKVVGFSEHAENFRPQDEGKVPETGVTLENGKVREDSNDVAVELDENKDKFLDSSKADLDDSEDSTSTVSEEEGDGVYLLAKSSGMSNVVATACSALDKLLTAALQSKTGVKVKAGNSSLGIGNGKRGKALSAEMYVALTEAFVDMVHVLKDNVDLLSWCLNCLGSILPPGSLDRTSFESSTYSSVAPVKETVSNDDDVSKADNADNQSLSVQAHPAPADHSLLDQKLFPSKALLKLATKYREHSTSSDFTLKIGSKSTSGSYVAAARTLSSGKSYKGMLQSTFCGGISSESTSSSISALAAVAYAATVPMLAEKAVKAILNAMQSCSIESHSTMAALRALSAHLSSTNSKTACDDAFTFIIAAMREFANDADMQAESCLALGSLIRAVSSTTGHAAWAAITIAMDNHPSNLAVQRAGCGALQVLCTRTGLGVPEWRTGKRPLRASRDIDREAGARALISSMASFPNDVRIQWHGCSTLWTLVHSAGVKSVANMVNLGAVTAVVGAMSVCRMNEMMQQEGCNVIGTMVRTLAENGHEIGLFLSSTAKSEGQEPDSEESLEKSTDWWAALGAVVSAMKMFSKSKSLQSNGTFALGCILKGSGETATFGSTCTDVPVKPAIGVDAADAGKTDSSKSQKQDATLSPDFPGKDIVDNVERISAAVEATMAAMREFSKVETVQVWGCAVLQQAFLPYVHYAKCLGPVCASASSLQPQLFSQHLLAHDSLRTESLPSAADSNVKSAEAGAPSPSDWLAKFILSQAASVMYMISRTMAFSYNNSSTGSQANQAKATSLHPARGKPTLYSRTQTATSSIFFSSVRQSWCAALGAIGDVFGYLTRDSEIAIGKGGFTNSDCVDFFRSNKSFLDRSNGEQFLNIDMKSSGDDESEDGAQSEKSSLDTAKPDEESERKGSHHICSSSHKCCGSSSWIDWSGFGASQQQAVKDIKAWQEATESMAKIAEDVGFPLAVKHAILSIRTIFYKLEDAETVIWACHALVSLYLTWENLHLFKPGTEVDREEYKAKIWGEGEAGVKQLVDLVVHWTSQNRLDVTSLALHALYGACVSAATVKEIETVFDLGCPGAEAVLGAMQKALLSGSAQHRRKVVQQACCVLATVCGCSVRAQVAVSAHGGADLILTVLDRYNEDSQIQVNGLHALGIDSHGQPDFDAIWNSAISKTVPAGKSNRRRRNNQASASIVGLTHIFREGVNCPSFRDTPADDSSSLRGKWNPFFERLVLDAPQVGLFQTAVIAAPGCGGPAFALELFRRVFEAPSPEVAAHVCFVIGYMAEHNSVWRASFLEDGALQGLLECISSVHYWKRNVFTAFGLLQEGAEVEIQAEAEFPDADRDALAVATSTVVELRILCAAFWAVAGLMKDRLNTVDPLTGRFVQALAAALHRHGGLLSIPSYGLRLKKPHMEVCASARLALARLGVFRIATASQVVFLVHEAAEAGDVTCLKALVERGVDVFVTDGDGKNGEWHSELFGQNLAAQFFKEQVQLQGRKKAREKAKAKSKQNSKKKATNEAALSRKEEQDPSSELTGDVSASVSTEISSQEVEVEPAVEVETVEVAHAESVATNLLAGETTTTVIPAVSEATADCLDSFEGEEKAKISQKASKSSKKKSQKGQKVAKAAAEPVSSCEKQEAIELLNATLREAMASGEVEKMEAAISACEDGAQELVDERLLKQVKGALAKRLKRREKASVLEDDLTSAIEDGSYDRLKAAVLAVEQSSRFAAALQEKLAAAKRLLLEMESQTASEPQQKEEESLPVSDVSTVVPTSSPPKAKKDKPLKPKKPKSSGRKNTAAVTNANSYHPLPANGVPAPPDPSHRPPPTLQPAHDLPPLLPTPRPTGLRPPAPPCSVIMPPKSSGQQQQQQQYQQQHQHHLQASTSCEHNPITPQLFPSSRSPLNGEVSDYNEASQFSVLLSSSWSSPRSCSSLEDDAYNKSSSRWGRSPGPENITTNSSSHSSYGLESPVWSDQPCLDSQGYISALLATLFPVERLPSTSTTLFSASLGEFPAPAAGECGGGGGGGAKLSSEDPCRMKVVVSSQQSRVEAAALLEASLEDCCCICFDVPKDAALVPCGHRMCKSCGEQIRRQRAKCPICNRYIDAVLALYG
ncbi:hypothetical protein SELMODRAFT_420896 [Selaginella moellendorffii]|uniref:RING-type domain-containing protein n=1 Tax=Selaginella moellendorffii TaxID=88036 RepID=D8SDG7_SELML|nr:hypothetical protein SELMODRAFT_420896 [Selaginella moellendorffii]